MIAGALVVVGTASGIAADRLDKYEDPAEKTQIEIQLEAAKPEAKSSMKSELLAAATIPDTDGDKMMDFTLRGIDVEILEIRQSGALLYAEISAEKDGKKLVVDNPLWFKNPPIKVPTGKFHRRVADFGLGNEEMDIENTVVDVNEALKEILTQVVELQNEL